jgi:predicted regulator of Ras-like GTPase activity (Roadblock/LC7/MglB family)
MAERSGFGLEEALAVAAAVPGVIGGVLATEEGLLVASRLTEGLDEEALAGAAAALGAVAGETLAGLGRGEMDLMVLEVSKMSLVVSPVAVGYLMVVAEPDADAAEIAEAVNRAAELLARTTAALVGSDGG